MEGETERMHTWLNPKDPSRPKRKREGAGDEGASRACREKPKGVKREGGRNIMCGHLSPNGVREESCGDGDGDGGGDGDGDGDGGGDRDDDTDTGPPTRK